MRFTVFFLTLLMASSTTFCIALNVDENNSLDAKLDKLEGGGSTTWVISPSSGSHFGGDNITLTGSDFSSFFPEPDL